MTPYWSYVLTALGVLGLLLAGSRKRVGWALGLAAQPLWALYAVATGQWGFILSAVIYGATYSLNWWRWRREALQPPAPVMTAPPWRTFREQEQDTTGRYPAKPPRPTSVPPSPRATRHASFRGSGLALCGAPVGVMTVDQHAGEGYDCGACRSRTATLHAARLAPPNVADTFPPPSYED